MNTDIRVRSNKRCIISLANERGNYYKGLERLEESLKGRTDADFIGYKDEKSVGAPNHLENMYAFKVFAFAHTLAKSYSQIVWLDCSVYAIGDLSRIFELIDRDGYVMQEAGHLAGTWANDKSLDYFNISRDEAMSMTCYGNAGFLGLDFDNSIASEFFRRWSMAMLSGMFIGEWNNDNFTESLDPRCKGFRHDFLCGSIIANQLGMKFQKGDEILQYGAPEDKLNNDTIVLKAAGL